MAKIVGTNAEGQIVQAAAGPSEQPSVGAVGVLAVSAVVGGGLLGSILASEKSGDPFSVVSSGKEPTDAEEWISFVGAIGGLGVTAKMTQEAVKEYGLKNVMLFGSGLTGFVWIVRKLRRF